MVDSFGSNGLSTGSSRHCLAIEESQVVVLAMGSILFARRIGVVLPAAPISRRYGPAQDAGP